MQDINEALNKTLRIKKNKKILPSRLSDWPMQEVQSVKLASERECVELAHAKRDSLLN